MGHRELLAALRREGEERATALASETGATLQRLENEAAGQLAALRSDQERHWEALCGARHREILAMAEQEAGRVGLKAEQLVTERLAASARAVLGLLRNGAYASLFAGLVAELDGGEWALVRVNPADVALAASHFPTAEVVPDPAILGGFTVESRDGELTVVNTLERRLERAWPDMLPSLMGEFRGEVT